MPLVGPPEERETQAAAQVVDEWIEGARRRWGSARRRRARGCHGSDGRTSLVSALRWRGEGVHHRVVDAASTHTPPRGTDSCLRLRRTPPRSTPTSCAATLDLLGMSFSLVPRRRGLPQSADPCGLRHRPGAGSYRRGVGALRRRVLSTRHDAGPSVALPAPPVPGSSSVHPRLACRAMSVDLLVVGGGKTGSALVSGLVAAGWRPDAIGVVEPDGV